MRIAGVYRESIVDGPGLRFAIFTQGCKHACFNCHNPETWDMNGGYDCSFEKLLKAIDENPLLDSMTIYVKDINNSAIGIDLQDLFIVLRKIANGLIEYSKTK